MITNTASTITHDRAMPPEGPYDIPFRFDAPSWLAVTLLPPISTEGGEDDASSPIPLEHGLDYRLSAGVVAGRTHLHALLPVPEGHRLQIQRATPAVQHLDLIPAAPLAVKDLERSLDRIAECLEIHIPQVSCLRRGIRHGCHSHHWSGMKR